MNEPILAVTTPGDVIAAGGPVPLYLALAIIATIAIPALTQLVKRATESNMIRALLPGAQGLAYGIATALAYGHLPHEPEGIAIIGAILTGALAGQAGFDVAKGRRKDRPE